MIFAATNDVVYVPDHLDDAMLLGLGCEGDGIAIDINLGRFEKFRHVAAGLSASVVGWMSFSVPVSRLAANAQPSAIQDARVVARWCFMLRSIFR